MGHPKPGTHHTNLPPPHNSHHDPALQCTSQIHGVRQLGEHVIPLNSRDTVVAPPGNATCHHIIQKPPHRVPHQHVIRRIVCPLQHLADPPRIICNQCRVITQTLTWVLLILGLNPSEFYSHASCLDHPAHPADHRIVTLPCDSS